MKQIKIAIILPSRGLMFSRTAAELLKNTTGRTKIFFSHKRPIPECFEEPLSRALADPQFTHIWFVEDDMILPPNLLDTLYKEMQRQRLRVITCDYPVSKAGQGAVFEIAGEVIICGTGCLLIERGVFDELSKPYFRTDIGWNMQNYGTHIRLTGNHRGTDRIGYGLHDVNFSFALRDAGIEIGLSEIMLGQRKLLALGKVGSNNGAHAVEEWTKVKPDYLLKQVKSWPVQPKGKLVGVTTPTGTIETSRRHAKRLVKEGLGILAPRKKFVIDRSQL